MAVDNGYNEVVDGATNFQKREIAVSAQSSPTDKLKAHQEAVYRDTHREVYREVDRQAYQIDQDSTDAAYRECAPMKSTGWSLNRTSNYESMPSTDDYRLQDIFSRACGSTAERSDRASALELGKYNHVREAYVLDIDE
jgi:hypothetical protein